MSDADRSEDALPNSNAETTPEATSAAVEATQTRIHYLQSYYFLFDNQAWAVTILIGAVCFFSQAFVPLVGIIPFWGYCFAVIESRIRRPNAIYPEFSFQQFNDYLGRAVWPFLLWLPLYLLSSLVVGGLAFAAQIGGLIGISSLEDLEQNASVLVGLAIGIPILILLWIAVSVVFYMLLTPVLLRAGLTRSFVEGLNWRWHLGFVRRVWMELILALLFLAVTRLVLSLLGLLMCCVGIYATEAAFLMAKSHLDAQLYQLYLVRGGEPIPLAEQDE